MDNSKYHSEKNEVEKLKDLFLRYLSFWPIFVSSVIVFIILAFTYLRYTKYYYQSTATIEIIDTSQDSEMALPTAMTVFNRSMINLDNEIGVLNSQKLHKKVFYQYLLMLVILQKVD